MSQEEVNEVSSDIKDYFIQIGKAVNDPNVINTAIPIYTGGNKETAAHIYEAAIAYLSMRKAQENKNSKEYNIFYKKYEELRITYFSDFQKEELALYLTLYMQFTRRYLNRTFNSAKDEDLSDLSGPQNRYLVTRGGNNELKPIINSAKPSVKAEMNKRDRIRRRHRAGAQNQPDSINVTLINSFVHLRIRRPTRIELISLINTVEKELRHYGERWAINSINLERAGIARIIVDFFIGLIQYHSVEDILDPNELKSILLVNDIDGIAMTLLEAGSPNGVHYNMTCLANRCNYSEVKLYDPHDLYIELTDDLDDDQKDFLSIIKNTGKKYPIEEILKYQNRYKWKGKPIDTVQKLYDSIDGKKGTIPYGEMNVSIPTMDVYFNSFDMMAQTYNPTIQKYALDYPDVSTFRKKRSEFLGGVRMGEYVHWISNYIVYGDKDIDGAEDIIEERGMDQRGFEEGLLDIFSDDDEVYWSMFGKIMETIPFMTHTLTGFADSQCSACGGIGGQEKDKDGKEIPVHVLTKSSGFTPIDPVLNFFDLTRMRIEGMGEAQRLQEEIIS